MSELKTTVHTVVWLALTVLLWAGAAQAVPPSTPLEIQFIQRDLVVIGKVIEVGEPVARTYCLANNGKELSGCFRKFRIEVDEVFKDASRAIETGQKDGRKPTIEVWATAPEPGGPPRTGPFNPNLKKDTSYVLFLKAAQGKADFMNERTSYVIFLWTTQDKGAFFLPGDMAACQPMTEDFVARVRKIVDVPKWPWGADQNGLQLALLGPDGPQKLLPAGNTRKDANIVLGFLMAVRNTSANPVALELDSAKKPLMVEGTGPKGEAVTYDIYQDIEGQPLKPNRSTVTVGPGQVAFLGPTGLGVRHIPCFLSLSEDKWNFRLICSVKGPDDRETKQAWHGTVRSAPVEVKVER